MRSSSTKYALAAGIALAVVAAAPVFAEEATTAEQTINVMNKLFGSNPGKRANHAKGVVAEGSFTPSA